MSRWPRSTRSVLDRFWEKVDRRGDTDCWLWMAGLHDAGYGAFGMYPNGYVYAHRFAYELMTAQPIPPGLVIDHLCRNRRCVNPAHLDVVTAGENVLRGNGRMAVVWRSRQLLAAGRWLG